MKNKGTSVEQVMEEVNRAVASPQTLIGDLWKEERPAAPNLSFLYPPYSKSLAVNLDMVARNWEIQSDFELGTSRRALGFLAVAVKRVTRAMTAWYVNPIVHQVRKFNMLVTRTLHDIVNNLEELTERVAALENEHGGSSGDADLSDRVAWLEGEWETRRKEKLARREGNDCSGLTELADRIERLERKKDGS